MRARLVDAFHNRKPDEDAPGLCLLYRIEQARGTMQVSSDLQALEYFDKSGIKELQLPPWSKYFLREYL